MNANSQYKYMPCPECGAPIPMSMEILLSGMAIHCPSPFCKISLNVDMKQSEKAIKEVQKLQNAVNDFENKKKGFR